LMRYIENIFTKFSVLTQRMIRDLLTLAVILLLYSF
jgi:hypothetical protein